MTTPIPPGMEGLIPHLVCSPCKEALEFYKKAFGAEDMGCMMAPDGERVMHASMMLNGQPIFFVDDFPEYCGGISATATSLGGSPVTIHRYVKDCDAAVKQAEQAGAKVVMPPADMFWGDRYAVLEDPYGHKWSLATHIKDMSPEEMVEGMNEAFSQAPPS